MTALTIESATRQLAGRFSLREFVQADMAVSYRHFRLVVTGKRGVPATLIRRMDQIARAQGAAMALLVPGLPTPIQIGLAAPSANPSLN